MGVAIAFTFLIIIVYTMIALFYHWGHEDGYEKGYDEGQEEGYTEGYLKGCSPNERWGM